MLRGIKLHSVPSSLFCFYSFFPADGFKLCYYACLYAIKNERIYSYYICVFVHVIIWNWWVFFVTVVLCILIWLFVLLVCLLLAHTLLYSLLCLWYILKVFDFATVNMFCYMPGPVMAGRMSLSIYISLCFVLVILYFVLMHSGEFLFFVLDFLSHLILYCFRLSNIALCNHCASIF